MHIKDNKISFMIAHNFVGAGIKSAGWMTGRGSKKYRKVSKQIA